jgi:transposase
MNDVTTFESAFEASAGGKPRRMDVVPAGRERRNWTPEAKARIIAKSMVPRVNVA